MESVLMSLYLLLLLTTAATIAPCHAQASTTTTSSTAESATETCQSPVSIDAACRSAAEGHSAIAYEHCVASLTADPRSGEAGDHHALAVLATKLAIEHAASTEARIDDLADLEDAPHARARFNHCLELYSGAANILRDALDNLNAHIYGKASEQLAAALGASESCEDVWKGEERVPVAGHDREYGRMAVIALGLTNSVE